jgi:hypothetical protein
MIMPFCIIASRRITTTLLPNSDAAKGFSSMDKGSPKSENIDGPKDGHPLKD